MGIFSRLGTLIKSNLNDLISKAEDPQKMLNQLVTDMQNQLVEAKKQVAVSIADQKRLEKQRDEQTELVQEWERKAMLAVGLSFLGMLVYVGFRFKPIYGVGAVVALFHDLAITLGLFALTRMEISLTVIAALLTLLGYSMNINALDHKLKTRFQLNVDNLFGNQTLVFQDYNGSQGNDFVWIPPRKLTFAVRVEF